jgi:hypothetical protein
MLSALWAIKESGREKKKKKKNTPFTHYRELILNLKFSWPELISISLSPTFSLQLYDLLEQQEFQTLDASQNFRDILSKTR